MEGLLSTEPTPSSFMTGCIFLVWLLLRLGGVVNDAKEDGKLVKK